MAGTRYAKEIALRDAHQERESGQELWAGALLKGACTMHHHGHHPDPW